MEDFTAETLNNDFDTKGKKGRKRPGKVQFILLAIVLVGVAFYALIDFITDWLWFKELGYVSVFLKQLFTELEIGIPVFLVVAALTYFYLRILKHNYWRRVESEEADKSKTINRFAVGLSVLYGFGVAYVAVKKLWFEFLLTFNGQDFGIDDPIFHLDASFYAFRLDFISDLNVLIIGALIGLLAVTIVFYAILLSLHTPQIFEDDEAVGDQDNPFAEKDEFEPEPQDPIDEEFHAGKVKKGFFKDLAGKAGFNTDGPRRVKPSRPQGGSSSLDHDNLRALLSIAAHQLMAVGVAFFVMLSVFYLLKQFSLLYTHTGAVYGAGFTDVHITLWMYRILMVLALAGAAGAVIAVKKKALKPLLTIPVIMILVGFIGTGAALLVQNFIVSPDEINKESKYMERNIEFTSYAYGLNNVEVKSFSASSDLTGKDIANNDETISNIRINDYLPAETFYNQTQSIRQYYNFEDVDVDRYMVNGDYTQVFLSSREIDEEKISNTWINQHLKYTHGYGITLSRVDKITSSGQPDMLIKNIPPQSAIKEVEITRPEIYFGEMTNMYVIVGTNEDEFDYPDGDNNKYSRYEGKAGIKLNPINRLMFAIREGSMKLLVSSNVKSKSRIIINRNIKTRVETIFPYLSYDNDPYMCTVDGRLYWIIDAYTTSSKFPYSEPYSEKSTTNYVRNSVKVIIDAYDGTVDYYIVDDSDAIAKTYQKIYPKLFKDMKEMPKALRAHLRYPNTMFGIQADVYRRYHMKDVKVFYQNEDLWDVSKEIYGTEEQTMEPSYYILSLPGEKKAEFVNSIAYTPRDKKNMTGLLVARNDGEHYGELVLYKLPKSKVVYGPMQIEAQIDQNPEISKEFSLWNSSGSKYSRGNLFVIPIEDSLLYVEPVYLEATNSSIPEVKRVIVAYGDQIAYEPTLQAALESLFGESANGEGSGDKQSTKPSGDKQMTHSEIIEAAQKAYDDAIAAQKKGDWASYGKHMKELEKYLNMLK